MLAKTYPCIIHSSEDDLDVNRYIEKNALLLNARDYPLIRALSYDSKVAYVIYPDKSFLRLV